MLAKKGVKWIIHRNFALVAGIIVCRPERDDYYSCDTYFSDDAKELRVYYLPDLMDDRG